MPTTDIPPSASAGPSTSLPEIPWSFIECSSDTLIILISHMLNLLIQHNDQVILTPDALTRFHSRAPPGISVIEYLRRIVKYTNMEVGIPLFSSSRMINTFSLENPTPLPPSLYRCHLSTPPHLHLVFPDRPSFPHRWRLRGFQSSV